MLGNVDAIINALGGTAEAGKLVGVSQPAVANWRKRKRIASEHFFTISAELAARGHPPPERALFGFNPESVAAE